MSKIENNPLLKGASGMLGDTFFYRTVRGQVQMANKPKKRKTTTEGQERVKMKFQEAAQFAKKQLETKASRELYEAGVTDKKHTAYLVAVSDYLIAPTVHEIDAVDYSGNAGDVILVRATDDFMVSGVKIILSDADGNILEKGEADPNPDKVNYWLYTVTVDNPTVRGTTIKAIAYDRPGNATTLEKVL